ncbi:hypothetical protein NDU88_006680 [Pleurodeles waltl]|uniref:Uncharacterized protein n=1 Tax=Pleurodeles waltl TaxID=8319 RepID=A0AAV7WGC0_PLEWA|nr:hypothetical protein NDU88_006680 [Pleurodeles waltl]
MLPQLSTSAKKKEKKKSSAASNRTTMGSSSTKRHCHLWAQTRKGPRPGRRQATPLPPAGPARLPPARSGRRQLITGSPSRGPPPGVLRRNHPSQGQKKRKSRPPAAQEDPLAFNSWGPPHRKGTTCPASHLQVGPAPPSGQPPPGRKGLAPAPRTAREPHATRQPRGTRPSPSPGLQLHGGPQSGKTADGPPSSTSSHLAPAGAQGNPYSALTTARGDSSKPSTLLPRWPDAGRASATPPALRTASR